MKKLTDYNIALKGQLWVNFPAIVIIIFSWYLLSTITNWNGKLCILVAGAIGWIYWEIVIDKWITWALVQNVEQKRLTKIGVRNLLLWGEFRVNKIAKKINNNNVKD